MEQLKDYVKKTYKRNTLCGIYKIVGYLDNHEKIKGTIIDDIYVITYIYKYKQNRKEKLLFVTKCFKTETKINAKKIDAQKLIYEEHNISKIYYSYMYNIADKLNEKLYNKAWDIYKKTKIDDLEF